MADKNVPDRSQQTSEKKDSSALLFKVLIFVIVLSVLTVILKSSGIL